MESVDRYTMADGLDAVIDGYPENTIDFLSRDVLAGFAVTGLSDIERLSDQRWRFGLGSETVNIFDARQRVSRQE